MGRRSIRALASLAEMTTSDAPIENDTQAYITRVAPPVLLKEPRSRQPSVASSSNTLHILGDDHRSQFLAYALQKKYDSVQWLNKSKPRFTNIAFPTSDGRVEKIRNTALPRSGHLSRSEEPIRNLVVTGSATRAVETIGAIGHRLQEDSVVCLMQDGLGVMEAIDRKIAETQTSKPSYVVGHMSQSLTYSRSLEALVEKKEGRTALTAVAPSCTDSDEILHGADLIKKSATANFFRNMCTADHLNGGGFPFHKWLKLKLPTLVFQSVVEPVCVALDCRYSELGYNPWGRRLMQQLLDEVAKVAEALPEVQAYPELQAMLRGEGIRKKCFMGIRHQGEAPSIMQTQISRGLPTDINFLNGYFMRRGKKLGINLPANEFVMGMVKAKHAAQVKKMEDDIPWEEAKYQ